MKDSGMNESELTAFLQETSDKLREVPWLRRLKFTAVELTHAIVNIGPENVRPVADRTSEQLEEAADYLRDRRVTHRVGKALVVVAIGALALLLLTWAS